MQIGFIDFSKDERNKILATLKMLGVQMALDELGIGVIRDAYADILFPGISTIQTRAKYFVLLPYIFRAAEKQKLTSGREIQKWIIAKEDKFVKILVDNSSPEANGIIGRDALSQNRVVKMKPSAIYWNGMRIFEIINNPKLSFSGACNIIAARNQKQGEMSIKSDGESFDDQTANLGNTVLFSPIASEFAEQDIGIELTKAEAEFLADKISKAVLSKNSLLAYLIKNKTSIGRFFDIPECTLPNELKRDYLLAKDFSEFIIGAHIRYNVIYSNYSDDVMAKEFDEWQSAFLDNQFNLSAVLNRINCNNHTIQFCKEFLECVNEGNLKKMDALIITREKTVKGDRAKLCRPTEYKYDPARPIHHYNLDFRFGTARTIIDDIIKGLEG